MTEKRRYVWRAGLAVAVVGAVSVGAIGIAAASDDDQTTDTNTEAGTEATQPAPTPDDDHWRGPWGGGPWRGMWGGGGLDGVLGADVDGILHGEVVLSKEGGGTQTVLVQKGAVTSVSATAVTVKSTDGFTTTYAVNGDTKVRADEDEISAVAKDEEVLVVAPKSGDRQTATVLVDLTDVGWK